jgi:hypothetical protein
MALTLLSGLKSKPEGSASVSVHRKAPRGLQRKCACGGGASGDCSECSKKKIFGLQTKLQVSEPGDMYEREADRIADQVMATPPHNAAGTSLPRIGRVARRAEGPTEPPGYVDHAIAGPGRPLDPTLRQDMEQRFGRDFSHVRVHVDSRAYESAAALGANAYTLGQHVVFSQGAFDPVSATGRSLIAHELAHTIQQRGSGGEPLGERQAGRAPQRSQETSVIPTLTKSRLAVARQPSDDLPNRVELIDPQIILIRRQLQLPVLPPAMQMALISKLQALEIRRQQLLTGGGSAEPSPEQPSQETVSGAASETATPKGPFPPAESWGSASDLSKPQWLLDLEAERLEKFLQIGGGFAPVGETEDVPPAPETACHTDPNKSKTASSSICGGKRPDEATLAAMKAMERQPDFTKSERAERAKLDRLYKAYLNLILTGKYIHRDEFSPIEIEKDRLIPVSKRWELCMKSHGNSPNNLEAAEFDERFFLTTEEYHLEWERRFIEYKKEFKQCGHSRPSHFQCRDRVMAKYTPGLFAKKDAAARWAARDMAIAMPVLRHGGFVASATFYTAHEQLGWSTEKSAAVAGIVSTGFSVAGLGILKYGAQRESGGAPEAPPPPAKTARAPAAEPMPTPDEPPTPAVTGGVVAKPATQPAPAPVVSSTAAAPSEPAPDIPVPIEAPLRTPVRRQVPVPAPIKAPISSPVTKLPTEEIAALRERFTVLARKNVIVGMQAKLTLTSDEPVLEGIGGAKFSKLDKSQAAALSGTGRAAVLPPVPQPPGTPAKKGTQPSSGLVLEPEEGSRQVEVLAWNTSAPERGHNVSHAERQFIEWFASLDPRWLARVKTVDVVVIGRDICISCDADIKWLAEKYPDIEFNWIRGDPEEP